MKLIELDWGLSPFICNHFGLICDLFIVCDPPRWTPLLSSFKVNVVRITLQNIQYLLE